MNKTQYLVRKVGTCHRCQGTGFIELAHCRKCEQILTDEEFAAITIGDALPCGHSIDNLAEEDWCIECEGTGKVETWIDLEDALQEVAAACAESWSWNP